MSTSISLRLALNKLKYSVPSVLMWFLVESYRNVLEDSRFKPSSTLFVITNMYHNRQKSAEHSPT